MSAVRITVISVCASAAITNETEAIRLPHRIKGRKDALFTEQNAVYWSGA
jgi:hypothetical protein